MESRNCQGIRKQGKDRLCILSIRRLSSAHRQNVVCVQVAMRYRFQAWWW